MCGDCGGRRRHRGPVEQWARRAFSLRGAFRRGGNSEWDKEERRQRRKRDPWQGRTGFDGFYRDAPDPVEDAHAAVKRAQEEESAAGYRHIYALAGVDGDPERTKAESRRARAELDRAWREWEDTSERHNRYGPFVGHGGNFRKGRRPGHTLADELGITRLKGAFRRLVGGNRKGKKQKR